MVAAPYEKLPQPLKFCNTIMDHFMGYFGTPTRIVCDQDPAFMSHLCPMVSTLIWYTCHHSQPHKSPVPLWLNMALKVLANILMKHLTGLGDNWPSYCKTCNVILQFLCYPPIWDNLSPFKIAIGRKATLAPKFEYKT